jgi:8-oxo-dGTP diphosphatase
MTRPSTVRVGVQALLVRECSILMIQRARGYGRGTWGLPGGHLEIGETILGCAFRELREETSLEANDGRVVAVADPLEETNFHMQIGVEISQWSGIPRIVHPEECADVRFWRFEALPSELFLPSRQLLVNQSALQLAT